MLSGQAPKEMRGALFRRKSTPRIVVEPLLKPR
jgi:hypothetical protein